MATALLDNPRAHAAECYGSAFFEALQPDPIQTISEWADEHMVLPSYDAEPGPWRTSRTPYLKEIMDCLGPRAPIREVTFVACAQIGKTSVIRNWIGHTVHRCPTSMLMVEPSLDMAAKFSKQRLAALFEDVPVLQGLVRDPRARDSGNTILSKEFRGGMIVLTGANSGPGLRFMSAKQLALDELDAYTDLPKEGPPDKLAEKRTLTYADYKIFRASTPLILQTSKIWPAYEASDGRQYAVPCPHCRAFQALRWVHLTWPKGNPERAYYTCEACRQPIDEHHKTWMLEQGRWTAQRPTVLFHAGFWINALYAPYGWQNSWGKLATEWSDIIHKRDRARQQLFTNLNLAECWNEDGEKIATGTLADRRETYAAPVPDGVLVLVGAIDQQDDRLEAEVYGYGLDEENWSIAYKIFHGSPAQRDVWDQAERWLAQSWTHEGGMAMKVQLAGVDTAGHHTKAAYEFVRRCRLVRVVATKGSTIANHPLVGRPHKDNLGRVNLYSIGTDTAKNVIFSRLKLLEFGPGYCHFPDLPEYDDEYFAQLTAEARMPKYAHGVQVGTIYRKLRARNEALDLRVIGMAALAILNPNLPAIAERLQRQAGPGASVSPQAATSDPPPKPPGFVTQGRPRGGGWAKGWRR